MAVKHLGKLTLDLVKEISQSENNDKESIVTKEIKPSSETLKDKFLALIDQGNGDDQANYSQHAESIALAHQVAISKSILQPLSDHSSFDQVEQQRMEKMSRTSAKISKAFKQEHERKEKLEKDRHDQLVSALERSNNQQALADENAQLKAEIEKLLKEKNCLESELSKLKTGSETNSNSQLLLISTLFAKYKADKPRVRTQDKTLKDIEEENISISGLSFSQTSKIMAIANNLHKQMKNIK